MRYRLATAVVAVLGSSLAATVTAVPPASAATVSHDRVAGADRYRTAVAVAEQGFPDGASTVVIARGDAFPDALAAGPLAAVLHAPVLLTPTDGLDPATVAEIAQLGATKAVVVGGSGAVSDTVLDELTSAGVTPERVSGDDRYGTAAAVARRLAAAVADTTAGDTTAGDTTAAGGTPSLPHALVVTGTRFPDALVAGSVAAALPPRPLLLVKPDSVPDATAAVLTDLGVTSADVVGGSAAVGAGVLDDLKAAGVQTTRLAGADRAATATAVAQHFASALAAGTVTLARGDAFPDALVAAPWSGSQHRALLLAAPGELPDSTVGYLISRHGSSHPVTGVVGVGGQSVLPDAVLAAAADAAAGHGTDGYRARRAYAAMTNDQRVGQLFMVGVSAATGPTAAQLSVLRHDHVGAVLLAGRSDRGVTATRSVTDQLRRSLAGSTLSGVGTLVATDQEGGYVQVLSGSGFSDIPRALTQGSWSSDKLRSEAQQWGKQLRSAGVDLNLAPVLDTVPAAVGGHNKPIGYYYREFGHTPGAVTRSGLAFVAGMRAAGESTTAKHFPGLGRAEGNTDTTVGVRDTVTTRTDAYLQPFTAAVRAGVPVVMISSATYTRIDASRIATFSPTVITGMLRHDLGFDGLVMSDSLTAKALSPYSPGTRAVRFLQAGGDLLLMGSTSPVAAMTSAIEGEQHDSAAFAARVQDAVLHVLLTKAHAGLL